jgi:GntR family transcriptional regulator/MocR family aminotransferase
MMATSMARLPTAGGSELAGHGREYLALQTSGTGPLDVDTGQPLGANGRAGAPLATLRAIGLSLVLDRDGGAPMHEQIADQLRDAIAAGRLANGIRLPSTRLVATHLRVSRNVVAEAYSRLERDGLVVPRRGAGTFVRTGSDAVGRPVVPAAPRWLRGKAPEQRAATVGGIDLRLRGGSLSPLPAAAWRQAWRIAATAVPSGYADAGGDPGLREAIAGYVTRTRGVACSPDDVVVTSGASDALALLLRAVWTPGEAIAHEDPGYRSVMRIAAGLGASVVGLPVDSQGAEIDVLTRSSRSVIAVHVTPSHQFPLGIELSAARRRTLLDWAEATGGLVIENDYDAEFRFGDNAVPPVAATDHFGCVALVGTFSRLLAPALRVGYIAATPPLAARIRELKHELDDYASLPAQHAVAHLIRSGELERHLRRVRAMATYKRARIAEALGGLAGVRVSGLEGGLHVLIEPAEGHSATQLTALLQRRGVMLDDLSGFYVGATHRDALLLDYSAASVAQLDAGLEIVRQALGA